MRGGLSGISSGVSSLSSRTSLKTLQQATAPRALATQRTTLSSNSAIASFYGTAQDRAQSAPLARSNPPKRPRYSSYSLTADPRVITCVSGVMLHLQRSGHRMMSFRRNASRRLRTRIPSPTPSRVEPLRSEWTTARRGMDQWWCLSNRICIRRSMKSGGTQQYPLARPLGLQYPSNPSCLSRKRSYVTCRSAFMITSSVEALISGIFR